MIALATVSGPLPKLGVVAVSLFAAGVLLARNDRERAIAMIGTLILSPPLLLASIWNSHKLSIVHRHPLEAVALALVGVAVTALIAVAFVRRPELLAALAVIALPFRIPISTGGGTTNLLVPLYVVVGAGALAVIVPGLRGREVLGGTRAPSPGWLERLLALVLVLYGLQAIYSPGAHGVLESGFQTALQNMVFFYVPFALLYSLLRRFEWTPKLLRTCLQIVAVLALACAVFGFFEFATRHTYFSSKLAHENQLYVYFVVNSVFYDPNIFGRFVALAMVALAALLLYDRPRREQLLASAGLAVLFVGLVLSFSRASMLALLAGLATLAANKWRPTRTLAVVAVVVVAGGIAVAISPTTFGVNQGLNGVSAGRGSVLGGGIRLFGDRPLWGFGSGSFEHEYVQHNPNQIGGSLTASHTIPVTIAAEQGVIGELAYLALVLVALVVLVRRSSADPARAAIAAAFVALVVHTMLYADFLEDPFTWTLLAVGAALARERERVGEPAPAAVAVGFRPGVGGAPAELPGT